MSKFLRVLWNWLRGGSYAAVSGGRSPRWDKVRADFLKLHDHCEACGGKRALNVHHKKPFHIYPELELEEANLITLCENGPAGMN